MNQSIVWSRITAVFVVLLGTAWAVVIIRALWNDFAGNNTWKINGTITVVFVLAIVLHWVAKGPRGRVADRP